MNIKVEAIIERDMDFLIMGALSVSQKFADLFLNQVGLEGAKIAVIQHSLTHPLFGESDITVVAEKCGKKYGILIEDKIDAKAMPDQCERYFKRGNEGKEKNEYSDFYVFITAPQEYFDQDKEAGKYPYFVSYEDIRRCRAEENSPRSVFDCALIDEALKKEREGYKTSEIPEITRFWKNYHDYCVNYGNGIGMKYSDAPRGVKSTWIYFDSFKSGTMLCHKTNQGVVNFEFCGQADNAEKVMESVSQFVSERMNWKKTGNSLSLQITVDPLKNIRVIVSMFLRKKINDRLVGISQPTRFAASV